MQGEDGKRKKLKKTAREGNPNNKRQELTETIQKKSSAGTRGSDSGGSR